MIGHTPDLFFGDISSAKFTSSPPMDEQKLALAVYRRLVVLQ